MSRADATPPAGGLAVQLHVNVPDINQFITIDIQPKITIDEALERAIAKLNTTASLKQPYTTETHGFYLPHQKIWCRNFMKVTDYKLDVCLHPFSLCLPSSSLVASLPLTTSSSFPRPRVTCDRFFPLPSVTSDDTHLLARRHTGAHIDRTATNGAAQAKVAVCVCCALHQGQMQDDKEFHEHAFRDGRHIRHLKRGC